MFVISSSQTQLNYQLRFLPILSAPSSIHPFAPSKNSIALYTDNYKRKYMIFQTNLTRTLRKKRSVLKDKEKICNLNFKNCED